MGSSRIIHDKPLFSEAFSGRLPTIIQALWLIVNRGRASEILLGAGAEIKRNMKSVETLEHVALDVVDKRSRRAAAWASTAATISVRGSYQTGENDAR